MIYNRISSKYFVASVTDRFNIKDFDFEPRVPFWVGRALQRIKVYNLLEPKKLKTDIIDYKVKLPCHLKLVERIVYDGQPLYSNQIINRVNVNDIENLNSTLKNVIGQTKSVEFDGNGYAIFSFEEGEIEIYYLGMPVEYDERTNTYFPEIPDNEQLKDCIEWFILMSMLMRGYIHPIYSLSDRSVANINGTIVSNNPMIMFEATKKAARNSVQSMSPVEREMVSQLLREFVSNYDYFENERFDNSAAHYKYTVQGINGSSLNLP